MGRLRKLLLVFAAVLVVALLAIQLVPVDRSNPPERLDGAIPAGVQAVLRRSCYDCHSNESVWPWYSYVAPVSWLVARDVREGREHVNFSLWDRYGPDEQADIIEEAYEEASAGEMPLAIYLTMHGDARLTADDLAVLRQWTTGQKSNGHEDEHEREKDEDDDH